MASSLAEAAKESNRNKKTKKRWSGRGWDPDAMKDERAFDVNDRE